MILEDITAKVYIRLAEDMEKVSYEEIKNRAVAMEKHNKPSFKKAIRQRDISFICEVKKGSPSRGIIAEAFPYKQIACDYEEAGAAAVSVLTERDFFFGSLEYLREIAAAVSVPVLRKDFIVETYQIYEAKVAGAAAVLLLCALLPDEELKEFIDLAKSLGMDALVEAHNAEEIRRALAAGADIIGVNNRNLKDFSVSFETSLNLRKSVPFNIVFVAESGIHTAEEIERLREARVDAVLIGEKMMTSRNKKAALAELRGTDEG